MGIWDALKTYDSEWEELNNRPFSEDEIEAIDHAVVYPGRYSTSMEFYVKNTDPWKKKYIPLEPSSANNVAIGDVIDLHNMLLVQCKYVGSDAAKAGKIINRIRIKNVESQQATSFDDPFGLNA